MKPPALKKGDTIGVMSTSGWVSQGDLDKAKASIEAKGYRVYIHPQATERFNQSAGSAESKVAAFHDLLQNPDVKAIFSGRGGNRAITMLDKIDFDLVAANPKIIIGYSDVTILLNAFYQKTGLTTFHGSLFRDLPKRGELDQMLDLLAGGLPDIDFSKSRTVGEGNAEGQLIGGNLSLLQALSGTEFQPDTNGAILFIEDAGDHISRYDRMIAHMKLAGWLNNISGLMIGSFARTQDYKDSPFGFTLEDIVREHTGHLDIPIVMDAPFGHGDALCTLPVGGHAKLEAAKDNVTFTLTEPAVRM